MQQAARDAVAAFAVAVDGLLSCGLVALSPVAGDDRVHTELVELLRAVEVQRRRLAVVDARLIAAIDEAGLGAALAVRNTGGVMREALLLTPTEARARVAAAADIGPRRALTGESLTPVFAHVAAAQAAGTLSVSQARVVVRAVETLPHAIAAVHGDAIERELVGFAETLDAGQLAVAARRIHDHLDPDGRLPDDEDHRRRRDLRLRPAHDGSGDPGGRLTPEALLVWQTILDSLDRPDPAGSDGERDDRTPGQRRHDAFLEAGRRLLALQNLPETGGVPVTIAVTMTLEQLEARAGTLLTQHGGSLSVASLLCLAGQAEIIPVVLGEGGGVLAYGRTRRVASRAQRRALAARDRGCSFPVCDAPPTWCEAHHVIAWIDDGLTDLDNLTLVCGYHHREFARRGWTCQMINGLPHWSPPAWTDPERVPRRNVRITQALWPPGNPDLCAPPHRVDRPRHTSSDPIRRVRKILSNRPARHVVSTR